jgi:hypothetical protein
MNTSHGGYHPGLYTVVLQDLQHIFGGRLHAFVAYGDPNASPAQSLALLQAITADDLTACAARVSTWERSGCATPLLLTREEFAGSLDAFPLEYGEILDTCHVIHGDNPFSGLTIRGEDVRRACEVQMKSLLLHLRENFVESRARPASVGALVADSAPAFAQLLRRLARLDEVTCSTSQELCSYASSRPKLDARVVGDVLALAKNPDAAGVDAARLFPDYLSAVEALWRFVDRWRHA